ncbi:hypothetical protein M1707_23205, partial [Salmonella enterica subsp. enterica serovar Saintpaul]
IVTAFAAGTAQSAGLRAIDRHELAGQKIGNARTDGIDHTGCFGADGERHLALGESHAAPAPDVDMVERDSPDIDRYFT